MTVGQNIASVHTSIGEVLPTWSKEASLWHYGAAYNESFGHYFQVSV